MKILFVLILGLLFSGCASLPGDLKKSIPNGTWATIDVTVTGKFSATKITGEGVVKDGDSITAKELHISHSNAWVPMIQINATGYQPKDIPVVSGTTAGRGSSIY
jgi:hypothetical protein